WSTPESCFTACVNGGYSDTTGCSYDSSTQHDTCFCTSSSTSSSSASTGGGGCTENALQCLGTAGIQQCSGRTWTTESWDTACKNAGYVATTGCSYDSSTQHDTCFCTSSGSSSSSSSSSGGGGGCSSGCPGDCSGSDVVCCPVCKGSGSSSYCGQYCCDSY